MDFSLLGFHGLKEVYNIHPVFVHFPIALFPLSLLFYLLSTKIRRDGFRLTAQLLLILAALSAIATMGTGLLAEESFPHNDTIHHMMQTHKAMAYFIVTSGILLTLWSFWLKGCRPRFFVGFLGALAFVCLSVLLNADLGGRMVFVEGAAVRPAAVLMEQPNHSHSPEHHHEHK